MAEKKPKDRSNKGQFSDNWSVFESEIVVRTFIKSLSLAAAVGLGLNASAPAAAFSVAVQPLHLQSPRPAHVAVTGTCRQPNAAAAVSGTPFFEMPGIAQGQGASGTSGIAIELSRAGSLISESVIQSSGNPNLDRAALLSARMTRFSPEISNCEAVGGTYLYTVTF